MRKSVVLSGLIPMIGVLFLTMLAYQHSLSASKRYDERMRADIQACAQQLTQAGLPGRSGPGGAVRPERSQSPQLELRFE